MSDTLVQNLSRAGWTALQAAVASLIVYLTDIDVTDEPGIAAAVLTVVAAVLSSVKSWIATKVGDPNTVEFK